MSILKDILDTVRDIDAIGSVDEYFRRKKYSSMSKRSLEGTLQFPVLVSRSLDIQTLQMITKALERQFASFAQVVLSMSPTLDVDTDKDAIGYLRNFHQNSDTKGDLKDVLNAGVDILHDNYNCFMNSDATKFLSMAIYEGSTGKVIADNKEQMKSIIESLNVDRLNDKFIPRNNFIYRFANESLSKHYNTDVLKEAIVQGNRSVDASATNSNNRTTSSNNTNSLNTNVLNSNNRTDNRIDSSTRNFTNVSNTTINTNTGGGGSKNPPDMQAKMADDILKDNDVKKSNELVPTTLHIRVNLMKDGTAQGYTDFIVGVKATMHPIKSDEMITNIVAGCKNNNKFFDFVRWTTGEISFFKDFLFNIKEIKDDVISRSAGASGWWMALKRRKALSKIKDALMLPNQILPNASIVISMEEVEFIKSQYGFDLMNEDFVDKIMATYFLISFVVVDNSTQIAHFMFDGQKSFQSTTFSGLERENGNNEKMFKDMLKLVNRV